MRFTMIGGCHVIRSAERVGGNTVHSDRLAVGVITANDSPEWAKQSQAKASDDGGATGSAKVMPTDCVAGEVSRVDAGRTASATSERMGVTGGESAAIPFDPRLASLLPAGAQPEIATPPVISGAYSPWSIRPGNTSRSTYP